MNIKLLKKQISKGEYELVKINIDNQAEVEALRLHNKEVNHKIYEERIYIANNDTLKAKRWKYEFEHYKDATNPLENLTQELEIDAMAFAQVVMENEYGIKVENPNPEIQEIIDKYIISGKILTDD